jgi:trk system potassium uptake protein TrkA
LANYRANAEAVVVIGLGRFGGALAESLAKSGHEVLGIDSSMKTVQEFSDRLTHVVQADSTDEDALRQLGVADFQRAVVGIGTNIEASVLTVVALTDLGVPQIWAKALTAKHAKILKSVGAQHVVQPEAVMGERIAHLITSKMLDFFEFEEGIAIAKTRKPLADPAEYGVKVIAEPREGEIIVAGTVDEVQRFAAIT